MKEKMWYAVVRDMEDDDWGTGSVNYDEAVKMVMDYRKDGYSDAHIAVIDDSTDNAVCVDVIREF
jgi:hypothetical protein